MVKKRSKQNNPEQKTRNSSNHDVEFGEGMDQIQKAKKKYENSGGQPVKSKHHPEPQQSR